MAKSLYLGVQLINMGFIDIFLGAVLAFGLLRGMWNGFFAELAALISLIVGIWAALKFSHLTKSILENHVSWDPNKIQITAFILTFILVVVGVSLIAKILTTAVGMVGLGLLNKIFGGIVGLVKMILLVSVLLNLIGKINKNGMLISSETIEKSILYNPICSVAAKIYPTIDSWYTEWNEKFNQEESEPTSAP